jgi:hypothetical protein
MAIVRDKKVRLQVLLHSEIAYNVEMAAKALNMSVSELLAGCITSYFANPDDIVQMVQEFNDRRLQDAEVLVKSFGRKKGT